MPHPENLIPFNKLTETERREMARKAGIASGQSRRIYGAINRFLALGVSEKEDREVKMAIGLKGKVRLRQHDIIAVKLIEKARQGNLRAIRLLAEITGDLTRQVQTDVTTGGSPLDIFAGLSESQVNDIIDKLSRDG